MATLVARIAIDEPKLERAVDCCGLTRFRNGGYLFVLRARTPFNPSFDDIIKCRDDDQGQECRRYEAAGYDGGETSLYIAADTCCQSRGEHTDRRDGRGHQNRAQAFAGSRYHAFDQRTAKVTDPIEVRNHDDPIHDGDPEQRNKTDSRRHIQRDPGDVERDQPAKLHQSDATENQSYVSQQAEARIKQDNHETEDQTQDQAEARLRPLLVLEVSDPFDAITLPIKRNVVGDGALGVRQKCREAKLCGIKFHQEVAAIHVAIDGAFAQLQLDARNFR